jgi:hypothetical protein
MIRKTGRILPGIGYLHWMKTGIRKPGSEKEKG